MECCRQIFHATVLQTKVLGLFPNHLEPKPAETQFAPYNFDRPDDDNEFRGLATSLDVQE